MAPHDDHGLACRAIENLIAAYAELVDDGDLAAVAALFADASFTGASGSVSGSQAVEQLLRANIILYEDGTPRTKHLITNVAIDLDDEAGTGSARSYFTVLQPSLGLGVRVIVSGRYEDRFQRDATGRWRFAERRVRSDLIGDLSGHLRSTTPQR